MYGYGLGEMLYTARLGSQAVTQHLAGLMVQHSPKEAVGKAIQELQDGLRRLEKIQNSGLSLVREGNQVAVELGELPPELEGFLELSPNTRTKFEVGSVEKVLAFPTIRESEVSGFPEVPGQKLVEHDSLLHCIAPLSSEVLADGFRRLDRHGASVRFVLLNPVDYTDLRKFGRDIIDVCSERELLNLGVQCTLWGASVLSKREFPVGEVQFLGSLEEKDKEPVWFRQWLRVTR